MANQYVDKADLKTYIGLSGTGQDTNIDNAIDGASRLIDKICGRHFWQDSSVTDKFYTPINEYYLEIDDMSTTTGLVVKTDTNDDGTHNKTLTLDTDFVLKPFNPQVHKISSTTYYYPQTEIHILGTRTSERFDPKIIKNVKVTAKFGWSAVPEAIQQATLIQATRLWKRKDTPFNVFGNEQTGQKELFNKFDPDAMQLIKGYIKHKL
tara:strand:+ start:971 stop:1594 length:624 start_codon:yes stop_codon:yes gene_type:complete